MPVIVALVPIAIGAANVAKAAQLVRGIAHAMRLAISCSRPFAAVVERGMERIVAFNYRGTQHTIKLLRNGNVTLARADGTQAFPEAIAAAKEMLQRGSSFADLLPAGAPAAGARSMLQAGSVVSRGVGAGAKVVR